jgi:hypothetical protein
MFCVVRALLRPVSGRRFYVGAPGSNISRVTEVLNRPRAPAFKTLSTSL